MSGHPNIYATVVFDLHPKVRAFVDQLNAEGQIDLDSSGHPYMISCDRQGPNFVTRISRNNRLEQFVLNPRKKADPVMSWNRNDGFDRPTQKHVTVNSKPKADGSGQERERRMVNASVVESIVAAILEK